MPSLPAISSSDRDASSPPGTRSAMNHRLPLPVPVGLPHCGSPSASYPCAGTPPIKKCQSSPSIASLSGITQLSASGSLTKCASLMSIASRHALRESLNTSVASSVGSIDVGGSFGRRHPSKLTSLCSRRGVVTTPLEGLSERLQSLVGDSSSAPSQRSSSNVLPTPCPDPSLLSSRIAPFVPSRPPSAPQRDPTMDPHCCMVPPLVRHMALLAEGYRHESQLLPVIAAAICRHMESAHGGNRTNPLSETEMFECLKKDLTAAYALIANDVRQQICSWARRHHAESVEASRSRLILSFSSCGSRSLSSSASPPRLHPSPDAITPMTPIPNNRYAPNKTGIPTAVTDFFYDLQARVHTAVAWNSSVLVLKHPYIIQSVCGSLGVASAADTIAAGVRPIISAGTNRRANAKRRSASPHADAKGPRYDVTTPVLEGYSVGALIPSSMESARLIHNYNTQLLVNKKAQIAHDANAQLEASLREDAYRPLRRASFTVSRAWEPRPVQKPQQLQKPKSNLPKPQKAAQHDASLVRPSARNFG